MSGEHRQPVFEVARFPEATAARNMGCDNRDTLVEDGGKALGVGILCFCDGEGLLAPCVADENELVLRHLAPEGEVVFAEEIDIVDVRQELDGLCAERHATLQLVYGVLPCRVDGDGRNQLRVFLTNGENIVVWSEEGSLVYERLARV